MDTALPQKFPFILDRNLAEANCRGGNPVCTSFDTVVLAKHTSTSTVHGKCLFSNTQGLYF